MKRAISIVALIFIVSLSLAGQTKPNYSGVWKLKSTASNELFTIEHQEPKIGLKYKIEDDQGSRSFEVKAQIDGKEYKQEIQRLFGNVRKMPQYIAVIESRPSPESPKWIFHSNDYSTCPSCGS
ncbi:MAG: hypothetical protein ACREA2_19230, partial [Blastocatellia bacterium]